MTDITKLIRIKDKMQEIEKAISELQVQHEIQKKLLAVVCTHPTTLAREHYVPGGYYDREYTDYWKECTICGATVGDIATKTGYFG